MDGSNNNQWNSQLYIKTLSADTYWKDWKGWGETHATKKYLNSLKMHCCHGDDMHREKH